VDPRTNRELKRYGAPAAFLAAATIAVILIKAGLSNGSETDTTTVATPPPVTRPIVISKLVHSGQVPFAAQLHAARPGNPDAVSGGPVWLRATHTRDGPRIGQDSAIWSLARPSRNQQPAHLSESR